MQITPRKFLEQQCARLQDAARLYVAYAECVTDDAVFVRAAYQRAAARCRAEAWRHLNALLAGRVESLRVYLAGPMRGLPEFNFPAFRRAAARLRDESCEVFSPAERDCERHGADISVGNATGDVAQAEREHGFSRREALREDLCYICEHAEAIALLPGWRDSAGATAEHAVAVALGLLVIELPE